MQHQRAITALATLTATIALAVTLSGCTVSTSSSRTVTPDAFERVVVDALADVSDATPEVGDPPSARRQREGARTSATSSGQEQTSSRYDAVGFDAVVMTRPARERVSGTRR